MKKLKNSIEYIESNRPTRKFRYTNLVQTNNNQSGQSQSFLVTRAMRKYLFVCFNKLFQSGSILISTHTSTHTCTLIYKMHFWNTANLSFTGRHWLQANQARFFFLPQHLAFVFTTAWADPSPSLPDNIVLSVFFCATAGWQDKHDGHAGRGQGKSQGQEVNDPLVLHVSACILQSQESVHVSGPRICADFAPCCRAN